MKKSLFKLLLLIAIVCIPKIGNSNAYFSDASEITNLTFSLGCWVAPSKPTLLYPANGYVANIGSAWLADPYMDWDDSWICPGKTLSYQYESYHDSGLTSLAYRSGSLTDSQIPAPGTPDGTYYWRVRAYDGEQWSDWSEVWLLTVDRTAPPIPLLISPGNNTKLNSSALIQTWQQVSDNLGGEVFYDYESYNDAALTSLRWSGTFLNSAHGNGLVITKHAEGAPNGHVYWRVRSHDQAGNISGWSWVGHFVIDNNLPNPSPDGSSSPSSDVVLNELLPSPIGADGASKPNGEWVELYNKSDATISVAGWHLTDADNHSVLINGDKTNTGGTDILGHGFLVVYTGPTSLTLNDAGDTVNLYSGAVNLVNLIDSHAYTGVVPEGKSIARFPDGGDTWYDPVPTPGEPNKLETETPEPATEPSPELEISGDDKNVIFTVKNIQGFVRLNYTLTYDTDLLPEGVMGGVDLAVDQTEFSRALVLGTCSTGGTCVYHSGVKNIHLKVVLHPTSGEETVLQKSL